MKMETSRLTRDWRIAAVILLLCGAGLIVANVLCLFDVSYSPFRYATDVAASVIGVACVMWILVTHRWDRRALAITAIGVVVLGAIRLLGLPAAEAWALQTTGLSEAMFSRSVVTSFRDLLVVLEGLLLVSLCITGSGRVSAARAELAERKKAEAALRESEERYRLMVKSTRVIPWEFDSAARRYTFVGSQAVDVLGYPVEDWYADRFWLDSLHPDDRDRAIRYCRETKQRGTDHELEYRMIAADGSVIWLHDVAVAVASQEGAGSLYRGIMIDVTERKRTEERLRFLSQIAEQVSDSVIATDLDHAITYANQATEHAFQYTREEILGRSPEMFNAEPTAGQIQEDIYRTAGEGRTWRGELLNRRKDGSTFPCELTVSPLVDDEGRAFAYVGFQRDVTDRKRDEEERLELERKIQQAQKLESLGVLAGGIAHDFNNLLVGILGYAELALADLSPVSPVRENLEVIETAAMRAADLSRQMLAYSGKGGAAREAIDLNELVMEMGHLLEVSISKRIVLKHDLATGLPAVEADPTQIRQVVMNLITNAAEAIGDKSGVISIRTGAAACDRAYLTATYLGEDLPEGTYVYLEVADTGCGMDAETMSRMFDPFFTTKFTGRGLGLAATLGIVRAHGGAQEVHSESGRGTTFKILLPALDHPAEAAIDRIVSASGWRGSGTILLADDEETVRTVTGKMLETLGFSVLTASDGREVIDVFRDRMDEIVCVLLDLTMPRTSGDEALRELRRVRDDVPVILSSGYDEQDAFSKFAGKGLNGFIQKPYRSEDLAATLKRVLG